MKYIQTLLIKLRLFDSDSKDLSLTSILLMVAIGRLAFFPADVYTVSILSLALLHANAKKFSQHKRQIQADKQADLLAKEVDRIKAIEDQLKSVQKNQNISKL